ncbi:hypothetical protein SKAU_G00028850 [Synaphobranchus kaupii]|uniref:Uncharacterized protein n=1 Tax=Synaphobranchus kaupii TaxID=118154 RepID=A0A9Q1JFD1_SYNKA|nr:hypothetical protein SKAU_G00028850 [Synaphobranchus kaupii]
METGPVLPQCDECVSCSAAQVEVTEQQAFLTLVSDRLRLLQPVSRQERAHKVLWDQRVTLGHLSSTLSLQKAWSTEDGEREPEEAPKTPSNWPAQLDFSQSAGMIDSM